MNQVGADTNDLDHRFGEPEGRRHCWCARGRAKLSAMSTAAQERATLVEGLVESLDKRDPALDALWLQEAESRITAYRSGELEAVDAEAVFAELGQEI